MNDCLLVDETIVQQKLMKMMGMKDGDGAEGVTVRRLAGDAGFLH